MALGAHSIPGNSYEIKRILVKKKNFAKHVNKSGESGFPLNAFFTKPQGKEEEDMKKYIVQVQEK